MKVLESNHQIIINFIVYGDVKYSLLFHSLNTVTFYRDLSVCINIAELSVSKQLNSTV